MDNKIKLGFWNYVESGVFDKDAVKDWLDLGCNLPMSFTYDCSKHKSQEILDILDECEKFGLKLIICDKRTHFRTLKEIGENRFIEGVRNAFDDFGKHPATFGFFIGDEPTFDELDCFVDAVKIVMNIMPNLVPFANLLPYWGGGSDFDMDIGAKEAVHTEAVEKILGESKIPLIGYDQYSQCLEWNRNTECGINSYFYVLDKYFELTEKYDIPFFVSLLAVGHWCYRVPTEEDIRWQIYTSLAHGARGIIWFHLYQYNAGNSYVGNPLIGKKRMRSPLFDIIARQQYIFNEYYREYFDSMKLEKVYHVGHIYNSAKRMCEDDVIKSVKGDFSYPTIVSYYKVIDSDKRRVSIVNASQRYSNKITVCFTDGETQTFWLAAGEMKIFDIKQ